MLVGFCWYPTLAIAILLMRYTVQGTLSHNLSPSWWPGMVLRLFPVAFLRLLYEKGDVKWSWPLLTLGWDLIINTAVIRSLWEANSQTLNCNSELSLRHFGPLILDLNYDTFLWFNHMWHCVMRGSAYSKWGRLVCYTPFVRTLSALVVNTHISCHAAHIFGNMPPLGAFIGRFDTFDWQQSKFLWPMPWVTQWPQQNICWHG